MIVLETYSMSVAFVVEQVLLKANVIVLETSLTLVAHVAEMALLVLAVQMQMHVTTMLLLRFNPLVMVS